MSIIGSGPVSACRETTARQPASGDEDEARIASAMVAAGVGEWDADLRNRRVLLSPWIRQLLGIGEADAMTIDAFRARYHPDDRERVTRETDAALSDDGRGFFRNRFRMVHDDGRVTWIDARAAIVRDVDGRAERTVGVMFDVTDQMSREEALEESKRRLEVALGDTAITLFQQDRDLRYTWIHNPRLGHAAAEVLGRTDAELMDGELAAPLEACKRWVIETSKAIRREVETSGPGGRGRYDLHIEPLRSETGEILGLTGAAVEIEVRSRRRSAAATRESIAGRELLLDSLAPHLSRRIAGDKSLLGPFAVLRRKLEPFAPLSTADIERLVALETRPHLVPARVTLIGADTAGGMPPSLIVSGWAVSYSLLAEGGRQIINFHLPGDLISEDSGAVAVGQKTWATVTDCVVCELDGAALADIRRAESSLAEAFRWAAARDETIVQQHLISVGRRSALARLAHLLLELGERLRVVGLADEAGYRCPLLQEHLADALGLTAIHVNRTLRELRRRGCATFRNGYVAFDDRAELARLAEYDSSFLDPSRGTPDRGMHQTG